MFPIFTFLRSLVCNFKPLDKIETFKNFKYKYIILFTIKMNHHFLLRLLYFQNRHKEEESGGDGFTGFTNVHDFRQVGLEGD